MTLKLCLLPFPSLDTSVEQKKHPFSSGGRPCPSYGGFPLMSTFFFHSFHFKITCLTCHTVIANMITSNFMTGINYMYATMPY